MNEQFLDFFHVMQEDNKAAIELDNGNIIMVSKSFRNGFKFEVAESEDDAFKETDLDYVEYLLSENSIEEIR